MPRLAQVVGAAVAAATVLLTAGCTSQPQTDASAAPTRPAPTTSAPTPSAGEETTRVARDTVTARVPGPRTVPRDLTAAVEMRGRGARDLGVSYWWPRHRDDLLEEPTLERRMPPCSRRGLWPHWAADAKLTDLVTDVVVHDGAVYAVQLAVYPSERVAERWMHQVRTEGAACRAAYDAPRDHFVMTESVTPSADGMLRTSLGVDEAATASETWRTRSGERGGSQQLVARVNNAVLLVVRYDPTERWPGFAAGPRAQRTRTRLDRIATAQLEQLVRPVVAPLAHHYAR